MIELTQDSYRKPKWVIRHYREIAGLVNHIEGRRPKLVSRIRLDEDGVPLPLELQSRIGAARDQKTIEAYIEAKTIMDVINTTLSERLRDSDAAIMTDVCLKGISVTEAAKNHGVSELTVKRARLRMESAYNDEIASREAVSRANRKTDTFLLGS